MLMICWTSPSLKNIWMTLNNRGLRWILQFWHKMWNSKFHIMQLLLFFRGVILKDQIKTAQEIQIIIAIIEVKDYHFSVWCLFKGRRSVLKDCCAIADNTVLPPETVVPPFTLYSGSPGMSPNCLYNFSSHYD